MFGFAFAGIPPFFDAPAKEASMDIRNGATAPEPRYPLNRPWSGLKAFALLSLESPGDSVFETGRRAAKFDDYCRKAHFVAIPAKRAAGGAARARLLFHLPAAVVARLAGERGLSRFVFASRDAEGKFAFELRERAPGAEEFAARGAATVGTGAEAEAFLAATGDPGLRIPRFEAILSRCCEHLEAADSGRFDDETRDRRIDRSLKGAEGFAQWMNRGFLHVAPPLPRYLEEEPSGHER